MFDRKRTVYLSFYYLSVLIGMIAGEPSVFVFMWSLFFELFGMLTAWIIVTYISSRSLENLKIRQYMTLVPAIIFVIIASHLTKPGRMDLDEAIIANGLQLGLAFLICMITQTLDARHQFHIKVSADYHLKNYFAVYLQVIILGIILLWIYTSEIDHGMIYVLGGIAVLRLVMDFVFRRYFHSM